MGKVLFFLTFFACFHYSSHSAPKQSKCESTVLGFVSGLFKSQTSRRIANLSLEKITIVLPELTPREIRALTRSQIKSLTIEQFEALSPEQIRAFSRKQIRWMGPQFRIFLMNRGTVYLGERSPEQIRRENEPYFMSEEGFKQKEALPSEDMSSLPKLLSQASKEIGSLTPENIATQVSRLSPRQIQSFPFEKIEFLNLEQFRAFFNSLSFEQLESLNVEKTIELIRALSTYLFAALEFSRKTSASSMISSSPILTELAGLMTPEVKDFKALFAIMLMCKLKYSDTDLLTDEQVKSLPLEFIKTFKNELTVVLTPEQKELLSSEQKEAFINVSGIRGPMPGGNEQGVGPS